MAIKHVMMVQHANGTQEAQCPDCGNPMSTNKFSEDMQPLFYCDKCGNFQNDDPREIDPGACPECGAQERREIDVENNGTSWGYVYACTKCDHVYTIRQRKEE